jgi:uncharacterized protein DUF3500
MGESFTGGSAAGADDRRRVLVARMAEAAADWLASLSPDQRRKARFDFPADDERTRWYYTPTERGGLPLAEMDAAQQRLAHRLFATGLSFPAYVAVSTIMGLENVLDRREEWRSSYPGRAQPNRGRDPLLYYLSVFGEPGTADWGWRLGGHHVSISYSVVAGCLASPTPLFFGSNPAEAPLVGPGVLRPLAGEEDLGRELLHSLDPDQTATAVLTPVAPTDIVQANRPFVVTDALPLSGRQLFNTSLSDAQLGSSFGANRRPAESAPDEPLLAVRYESTPKGLAGRGMTAAQRDVLAGLVRQYVDRLPEGAADLYAATLTDERLAATHFAWAGGRERHQPHYYRLQGPRLLVEYDNTQNDANHIHSVLRDPEGDFGADLLAEHYRHAH